MSSLTYAQATDEIADLFKDAWDAGAGGAPLLYRDVDADEPTAPLWARLSVTHFHGQQSSLSNHIGQRVFDRRGVVTVQLFGLAGSGLSTVHPLVMLAVDAFEGKSTAGAVWFRNVRAIEGPSEDKWVEVNVLADFEYSQIK